MLAILRGVSLEKESFEGDWTKGEFKCLDRGFGVETFPPISSEVFAVWTAALILEIFGLSLAYLMRIMWGWADKVSLGLDFVWFGMGLLLMLIY